jgi:hypothetical protein
MDDTIRAIEKLSIGATASRDQMSADITRDLKLTSGR